MSDPSPTTQLTGPPSLQNALILSLALICTKGEARSGHTAKTERWSLATEDEDAAAANADSWAKDNSSFADSVELALVDSSFSQSSAGLGIGPKMIALITTTSANNNKSGILF